MYEVIPALPAPLPEPPSPPLSTSTPTSSPSVCCSAPCCCQGGEGRSRVLVLDNEGSVARDHLANERTFLAWLRASLSLIGLGIAIAKFSAVRDTKGILSATLLCAAGLASILYGRYRYFAVLDALLTGKFVLTTKGIDVLVISVTILTVTVLIILAASGSTSENNIYIN